MKAVVPIPLQSSTQLSNENEINDDNIAKLSKEPTVKALKAKIKEDEKQKTGEALENKSRKTNLPSLDQEIFGSLVSLNEYASSVNRDQ